jgi:hypothetical protein
MATALKIILRDHERIATATEMSGVLEFLGKKVTGVYNAGDVSNFCCAVLMKLTDVVLLEINMFRAFVRARGRPVDGGLVIVVYGGAFVCIGHAEILCSEANALEFHGAFVSRDDFCFT